MKTPFLNPKSWLAFGLCALVGLFIAGCQTCKPGGAPGRPLSYNLQIQLGESLKDSSVIVDVIGAGQLDLERLRTYSVNKYWKPGDPLRTDIPKASFNFVGSQKLTQTLSATDPKWKQWIGAGTQFLVIVADLPGVFEDGKPGSQDQRRQIVPICECYWPDKTKELVVKVQASGVSVASAPRPGQVLPPGW
jgi:hypothetical protein